MDFSAVPSPQGLYDPRFEHDACGVAFVVDVHGRRSHRIIEQGLTALRAMEHRGAAGCEPSSGDGAGILVQMPDAFLRSVVDFPLPEPDAQGAGYACGIAFLPTDEARRAQAMALVGRVAAEEGLTVLGWRDLQVDPVGVGPTARSVMPRFAQVFLGGARGMTLERRAFCVRKRVEHESAAAGVGAYFPSLSGRTIVYKGMLTTEQLPTFYRDLTDPRFTSAIALVHSRFSTNTFPSWPLAHPYRLIAHNGEINTLRGNRNWMRAREGMLASDLFTRPDGTGDLSRLFPICTPDASDSASFDEVLELLHLAGRSLPQAVLMMIPEAWENHAEMDPARRAFYQFHSTLMEPWDGPACVAFTDGTVIGAVLDRNGLRPARWWRIADGTVVLASEVGVLDVPPEQVVAKGRLQPGRIFLVDTSAGRIVDDEEIKAELAAEHPYAQWLADGLVHLDDLVRSDSQSTVEDGTATTTGTGAETTVDIDGQLRLQQVFGYTEEELRVILTPMARDGVEPVGSMGSDTPVAVLSERPRLLYDYFSQLFAQVTNPPLDAIREELVTSLSTTVGPSRNLLHATPDACRRIVLPSPVLDNAQTAALTRIRPDGDRPGFPTATIRGLFEIPEDDADLGAALRAALDRVRAEASAAVAAGAALLVLTDEGADARHAPIPSLLLTAAVHHHLVQDRTRARVGLIVRSGDCREVHHVALLLGYGAAAVNPYLALWTVEDLARRGEVPGVTPEQAAHNYVKALGKGVLKVMSKMGISTVASYTGAQVFEALGLARDLVDEYFTGTTSRIDGVGLDVLAREVRARHRLAHADNRPAHRRLAVGGEYQWRREGELHLFNPETVFLLQHSTRQRRYDIFKRYTSTVDELSRRAATLRGLFELREGVRPPVPIEEVEPVSSIVRRFSTGAMSYGSISAEAHETLAVAMNRLGGKSNTGEGGEDADRYVPDANGDLRRSAIKQVASGRFGVTSEYLVNADDLQIKMAQGAKPGEGGQLPGHKVYPWIAKTRHSTPGVGLISPPPHHDIYSIEDLAQLIYDLKNANNTARIHVKLVAEVGVGTVAAGVAKAHADVVLISGHDGGTGASPLTSLKHAGAPWELGLAETQQTLLRNGLRDRIVVQCDGQLKTGRDVVVAALLGAEEFGFATAPLVVSGCVMMRVCHLDTCPVGVATQNPELRRKFTGRPEFVVTFFEYIAEEVREYLARLGFRSLDEAIGHAELLDTRRAVDHWKAAGLDLTPLLEVPDLPEQAARRCVVAQDHGLAQALDHTLIALCEGALLDATPVKLDLPVRNTNRTVGTMLGAEVTRRYGGAGLPDNTIDITLRGSAGQSFGAFLPRGVTLRLYGDANDYLGKGLSGGRIIARPDDRAPFAAEHNVLAGNVIGYGATGGEMFLRGVVGERFCVRNSGATAVVEGVGDHACEYMTGGRAVILGPTGRNLAAGMSGGIAYVLDLNPLRVNTELVDITELSDEDEQWLREIVERHLLETGSMVAAGLLADWDRQVGRFRRIMPRDYRRVLEVIKQAERDGRDVNEAIMEAVRG